MIHTHAGQAKTKVHFPSLLTCMFGFVYCLEGIFSHGEFCLKRISDKLDSDMLMFSSKMNYSI